MFIHVVTPCKRLKVKLFVKTITIMSIMTAWTKHEKVLHIFIRNKLNWISLSVFQKKVG